VSLAVALAPGCVTLGTHFDEGWWSQRHEWESGLLYGCGSGATGAVAGYIFSRQDSDNSQTDNIITGLVGALVFVAADLTIAALIDRAAEPPPPSPSAAP
jgi:hypothetical protein